MNVKPSCIARLHTCSEAGWAHASPSSLWSSEASITLARHIARPTGIAKQIDIHIRHSSPAPWLCSLEEAGAAAGGGAIGTNPGTSDSTCGQGKERWKKKDIERGRERLSKKNRDNQSLNISDRMKQAPPSYTVFVIVPGRVSVKPRSASQRGSACGDRALAPPVLSQRIRFDAANRKANDLIR